MLLYIVMDQLRMADQMIAKARTLLAETLQL
jgi:hypothetical protein